MEIAPGGKSDKIVLTGPDGKLTFGVDTLNAIFEPGLYAPGTYTLVTTSQGVEGRIDTFSADNHPPNFILDRLQHLQRSAADPDGGARKRERAERQPAGETRAADQCDLQFDRRPAVELRRPLRDLRPRA